MYGRNNYYHKGHTYGDVNFAAAMAAKSPCYFQACSLRVPGSR